MEELYDYLSVYIIKETNDITISEKKSGTGRISKYDHINLIKGKKYLMVYYGDDYDKCNDNNKIIGFKFPGAFNYYNPGGEGPYGELSEGYYFDDIRSVADQSSGSTRYYQYGSFLHSEIYKFFEIKNEFEYTHFFDIIKNNYHYGIEYDIDDESNDNIYVFKASDHSLLCANNLNFGDIDSYIEYGMLDKQCDVYLPEIFSEKYFLIKIEKI